MQRNRRRTHERRRAAEFELVRAKGGKNVLALRKNFSSRLQITLGALTAAYSRDRRTGNLFREI
jgi:hypothetical protein